jgi:hypothetical protein
MNRKLLDTIINMSYAYFENIKPTPDNFNEFICRMEKTYSDQKIDRNLLFKELEANHNVCIGTVAILEENTDHIPWFNPFTNAPLKKSFEWRFWKDYKSYLSIIKKWPNNILNSVDHFSSDILSRLEDPKRDGRWDRRGMVVGNVQSGKTANYTAVIAKAADAGYKLFIVLAGVHNSLRSQTQSRINEEFIGYDRYKIQNLKMTGSEKHIGVKKLYPKHPVVNTLTSSNPDGDFNKKVASQAGIFPSSTGDPIILIIKKNTTILKNLVNWLRIHPNSKLDVPTIVIDDECDYASVNTKEHELDENDNVIKEWDPAETNKQIRILLNIFEKSAYLGYTATPFANIFIYKDKPSPTYGDDLFPRSFIISLPAPDNYLGPERVFGLEADSDKGIEEIEPLPLIRYVEDNNEKIPDKHKKTAVINELPESMKKAIKSFILTCAVRSLRQRGTAHNSMLIHVTRYTAVQGHIASLVRTELTSLTARIMSNANLDDFKEIWNLDFKTTTKTMSELKFLDAVEHSWNDVSSQLYKIARTIIIKTINGSEKDYLDYKDKEIEYNRKRSNGIETPWEERGLNTIVIGGDKLSRGLTLEGLSISYYLRASRMYDTLMQMGRWFGYREGYSDLCRIYTTEELALNYRHIAGATVELREEINYMAEIGKTPEEFSLKVLSHPGRLIVTSSGKLRNAQKISISYSGQNPSTTIFDKKLLKENLETLKKLVKDIENDKCKEVKGKNIHWKNVSSDTIINFLGNYKIPKVAIRALKPELLAKYIGRQVRNNELTSWDVVIVQTGKTEFKHSLKIGSYELKKSKRRLSYSHENIINIGILISPNDLLLDLTDEERNLPEIKDLWGKDKTPPIKNIKEIISKCRPKERGLLLIYLPSSDKIGKEYGGKGEEVVGFAVSFPESQTAVSVEYIVPKEDILDDNVIRL